MQRSQPRLLATGTGYHSRDPVALTLPDVFVCSTHVPTAQRTQRGVSSRATQRGSVRVVVASLLPARQRVRHRLWWHADESLAPSAGACCCTDACEVRATEGPWIRAPTRSRATRGLSRPSEAPIGLMHLPLPRSCRKRRLGASVCSKCIAVAPLVVGMPGRCWEPRQATRTVVACAGTDHRSMCAPLPHSHAPNIMQDPRVWRGSTYAGPAAGHKHASLPMQVRGAVPQPLRASLVLGVASQPIASAVP